MIRVVLSILLLRANMVSLNWRNSFWIMRVSDEMLLSLASPSFRFWGPLGAIAGIYHTGLRRACGRRGNVGGDTLIAGQKAKARLPSGLETFGRQSNDNTECAQMEDLLLVEEIAPDMAFDNRFDGLDRRVEETEKNLKQLERRLPPIDFPFAAVAAEHAVPKTFLRRNAHWFPILTPIITVILFVMTLAFGLLNSVFDARIGARLNEPNGVNERLQKLSTGFDTANGELRAIRTLWEEQIKKNSQLNHQDFQKILPQAAETLKAATVLKVELPQAVTNAMQTNLLAANPQAPGYWPAVSQFITYRSQRQALEHVRALPVEHLPRCAKRPPVPSFDPKPHYVWSKCVLSLDETFIDERADFFWEKGMVQFRECIVEYSGRPIFFWFKTAEFHDCLFMFSIDSPPPASGKRVILEVLKSNSSTITLDTIGPAD
jgi:hypothetical protein